MKILGQSLQTANSIIPTSLSNTSNSVESSILASIDQQLAALVKLAVGTFENQALRRLSRKINELLELKRELENESFAEVGGWKLIKYTSIENPSRQFCLSKLSAVLRNDEGDYDEEFMIPSDVSISKMEDFIHFIYGKFNSNEIGQASFSPDGNGGIEATWRIDNRYLQIIVPSNKEPYLFHKHGSEFKIEHFSQTYELIKWFSWLIQ